MLCMCYPKIFNSNNFAIIAALSEECALQSTILSVHLLSRITFRRRLAAQYYDFLWKASTEGDIAKWCGENIPRILTPRRKTPNCNPRMNAPREMNPPPPVDVHTQ